MAKYGIVTQLLKKYDYHWAQQNSNFVLLCRDAKAG